MKWLIVFSLFPPPLLAQIPDAQIRDLKNGRVINDTSYIYALPYSPGQKFLLIQGWASRQSHKGELSLDFKMKTGTPIHAAREGVVTEVKEDGTRGGLKNEYLDEGNHIVIQHNDGTSAGYWHLMREGAIVKTGDTVQRGQHIGYSGNTGYSAFPHLHFWVYRSHPNFKTIPTRFATRKGVIYLRPGRSYRGQKW